MSPQEYRNNIVGIINLFYGAVGLFISLLIIANIWMDIQSEVYHYPERESGLSIEFMLTLLTLGLIVSLPAFLAGYALLRKRAWARSIGIIASVTAFINIPIGTMVSVYSLLFLLDTDAGDVYGKTCIGSDGLLHIVESDARIVPATSPWYVPPREMPDWRG
jgi:hypothetical protein